MNFSIWTTRAEERAHELALSIYQFYDSPLVPAWRKELDYLNYLREHGACPGGYDAWQAQRKEH